MKIKTAFQLIIVVLSLMLMAGFLMAGDNQHTEIKDQIFKESRRLFSQGHERATNIWVSNRWLMVKDSTSDFVDARETEGFRQVFLDVSATAATENSRMNVAVRLQEGFLVSGNSEAGSGDVNSTLTRYNDDGSKRMTVILNQYTENGESVSFGKPAMSIIGATEMSDGDLALFWVGKSRAGSSNILVGVVRAGSDLVLEESIYGPVDLGFAYFPVGYPSELVKSASDVRFFRNRLYIVDAFNGKLTITKRSGEIVRELKIRDLTGQGRPVVINGWSLEPDALHFQVLMPEFADNPESGVVQELFSYSHNGTPFRNPKGLPKEMGVLRPSEDGNSYAVVEGSVYKGILK